MSKFPNLSAVVSFANHATCLTQHTPEDNVWLIRVFLAPLP